MSFQIRPKLRSKLPSALVSCVVAIVASGASPQSRADELTTPPASAGEQARGPARGMSMEKVEAAFGAPTNRTAAVGEPPISRWEYPGFTVYFEHQFVLHTVGQK